jgi:hypothetical protein
MGAVAMITGAAVIISALVHHAFHSYLGLRERERLSTTAEKRIEADLDERFRAMEKWQNDVKNTLANLPRR